MKCISSTFLVCMHLIQVYERFDSDSIADVDDARLEYFSKKVSFLYFWEKFRRNEIKYL